MSDPAPTTPEPATTTPTPPDMATLFARDPAELTRPDIDSIILRMREARHLFNTGAPKAKAPAKLTKGQAAAKKLNLDLDLGDIGL